MDSFLLAIQPLLAQAARDVLRTLGTWLLAQGVLTTSNEQAFIGAAMTLVGILWGWFTTRGYMEIGALLKRMTGAPTVADAKVAAQIAPQVKAVGSLVLLVAATLAVMSALVDPARAGDVLPPSPIAKALASSAPCVVGTTATPTSCSGWYLGAGVGGNGTNANIVGNGINGSVFAAGVMPFVDGGYQYVQGNWTFGVDLKGGYQTASVSTVNSLSTNANGFRFIETFRAGGNVAGLLGNQTPITVPPLLANSLLTLYAEVGVAQRQLVGSWANGMASGAGALFDISSNSFLDLEYLNIQYNNASLAGVSIPTENLLLLSYKHKF